MSDIKRKAVANPPSTQETSKLADCPIQSDQTAISTPSPISATSSPVHHRTGYRRLASFSGQDTAYHGPHHSPSSSRDAEELGLGIRNIKSQPNFPQAGLNEASPISPETPSSANPLLSPLQAQSKFERQQGGTYTRGIDGDWDDHAAKIEPYQPFIAGPETENLHRRATAQTAQSFAPSGRHIDFFWMLLKVIEDGGRPLQSR